jgi:mono/diheme cytochrome c family protein
LIAQGVAKEYSMATTALSGRKRMGRWPASVVRCLAISLTVFAGGCDLPGRPNPADKPVPADQVLSFSILYGQNCAGCHGAEGKLGAAPPLNDELFRALVPEAEIASVVTNGRHKTLMPAFAKENGGALTATQIQVLVHEVKGIPYKIVAKQEGDLKSAEVVADASGISPTWGAIAEPPVGAPSYRPLASAADVNGSGSATQGAIVFKRACAVCHGSSGTGIAKGSRTRHAINDPVTLKLMSDQSLRRYVITGRPDLGMPSFSQPRPGDENFRPLAEQEISDLVALLASWRQPGAGSGFAKD